MDEQVGQEAPLQPHSSTERASACRQSSASTCDDAAGPSLPAMPNHPEPMSLWRNAKLMLGLVECTKVSGNWLGLCCVLCCVLLAGWYQSPSPQ